MVYNGNAGNLGFSVGVYCMKKLLLVIPILLLLAFPCQAEEPLRLAWGGNQMMVAGGGAASVAEVTNGEIGNRTGSDDDSDTLTSGVGSWITATTTTPGTVSYIHISLAYCYGTPKQINAGIYSSDGNTKLAEGNLITVGSGSAIAHIALDTPLILVVSTNYRLVVVSASNEATSVRTTNFAYNPTNHDTSFTAGDTLDSTLALSVQAQQYYGLRIWATNTADGS
jgi:hypothetical protein